MSVCDSRATHSSLYPSQPERSHVSITHHRELLPGQKHDKKVRLHRQQRFYSAPPTHTNPRPSQPSHVFTFGGARGRGVGGRRVAQPPAPGEDLLPRCGSRGCGIWLRLGETSACRQPSWRDPGFPHSHSVSCAEQRYHVSWLELCHTLIFSMLLCLWDRFYLSGNWT